MVQFSLSVLQTLEKGDYKLYTLPNFGGLLMYFDEEYGDSVIINAEFSSINVLFPLVKTAWASQNVSELFSSSP